MYEAIIVFYNTFLIHTGEDDMRSIKAPYPSGVWLAKKTHFDKQHMHDNLRVW